MLLCNSETTLIDSNILSSTDIRRPDKAHFCFSRVSRHTRHLATKTATALFPTPRLPASARRHPRWRRARPRCRALGTRTHTKQNKTTQHNTKEKKYLRRQVIDGVGGVQVGALRCQRHVPTEHAQEKYIYACEPTTAHWVSTIFSMSFRSVSHAAATISTRCFLRMLRVLAGLPLARPLQSLPLLEHPLQPRQQRRSFRQGKYASIASFLYQYYGYQYFCTSVMGTSIFVPVFICPCTNTMYQWM